MSTPVTAPISSSNPGERRRPFWQKVRRQRYLLLMLIPFVAWGVVYLYLPLYGWLMGFMDYMPGRPFLRNPWVGLKHFRYFITMSGQFWILMRNSIVLSLLNLGFRLPLAVILAITLSELRFRVFKGAVQTISYLPHFVSWVIVYNIFFSLFSLEGSVNHLLMSLRLVREPFFFLGKPELTWTILTFANVWKEVGWESIIFLGAIAAIDPTLYEAAYVDGAGRFKRILHVTIPGIMPTFLILLLLNAGWILNAGFEQNLLFGNNSNRMYAEVIDTYVFNKGLALGQFSFGTAVGIFKTAVSLVVLTAVNFAMKRAWGRSIW